MPRRKKKVEEEEEIIEGDEVPTQKPVSHGLHEMVTKDGVLQYKHRYLVSIFNPKKSSSGAKVYDNVKEGDKLGEMKEYATKLGEEKNLVTTLDDRQGTWSEEVFRYTPPDQRPPEPEEEKPKRRRRKKSG